ncbi:DUF397 domain-containing protein [Streptomyces sp. NPDC056568]|uniref:DUF397 domain-containing protein n=1 Tax=Streptomyces sp. NPDC056568 TaxID=3345866 RepID=UPI0036D1519A
MTSTLEWFKSSYSSTDGPDCVEVAIASLTPAVHVRDSKNYEAAHLTFADASWTAFIGAVGDKT